MKSIGIYLATILVVAIGLTGCASVAPQQMYRPANYAGDPYRISGKLEPLSGWNGMLTITINDQVVIKKGLPVFGSTFEATGTFDGRPISVTVTQVTTITSKFFRADVFVGAERAATLTF